MEIAVEGGLLVMDEDNCMVDIAKFYLGFKTINITDKTGTLVAIKDVTEKNDLMIITKSGLTIRMAVSEIRIAGRATQGVKLINIREGDSIAAVCPVAKSEDEEVAEETTQNED